MRINLMNKILLVAAISAIVSGTAFAQHHSQPSVTTGYVSASNNEFEAINKTKNVVKTDTDTHAGGEATAAGATGSLQVSAAGQLSIGQGVSIDKTETESGFFAAQQSSNGWFYPAQQSSIVAAGSETETFSLDKPASTSVGAGVAQNSFQGSSDSVGIAQNSAIVAPGVSQSLSNNQAGTENIAIMDNGSANIGASTGTGGSAALALQLGVSAGVADAEGGASTDVETLRVNETFNKLEIERNSFNAGYFAVNPVQYHNNH